MHTPLTLQTLNAATPQAFVALLDGVYEHSPWIAEAAAARRPFATLAQLKRALVEVLRGAPADAQRALIHAHPELTGRAAPAPLSADSAREQQRAGLAHCSPEELDTLQRLNADYRARFGHPFILAVGGPRGQGLTRAEIIAAFQRRLEAHPEDEHAECLRQVQRIAELRLNQRLGHQPALGEAVCDWADALAAHSERQYALTVTYLSPAHQACMHQLARWMREEAGFDEVTIDALGNVVGVFEGQDPAAPRLLTGSHYDTVRDAGRHDGRLGILAPLAAVRALRQAGRRLRFGIELVAFAEEEGQRYPTAFLGSSALAGQFDPAWLDLRDAAGVPMREAQRAAGLPGTMAAIQALRRDPQRYRGFVELHIEQGPVLDALDLPLGVVSSINGSLRYLGECSGLACHAGTTPMGRRRDAAAAVAELLLYLERRAAQAPEVVGTVGQLEVPSGSVNVVPGRCRFSLDIRATTDAARDACAADVLAEAERIAARRGVRFALRETLRAAAAPCDPDWQARWARAVQAQGLPLHVMPSGAGHDAMMLHRVMPQAMLFVRGGHGGISHNPLETITSDDADLAVRAFLALLDELEAGR